MTYASAVALAKTSHALGREAQLLTIETEEEALQLLSRLGEHPGPFWLALGSSRSSNGSSVWFEGQSRGEPGNYTNWCRFEEAQAPENRPVSFARWDKTCWSSTADPAEKAFAILELPRILISNGTS